MPRDSNGRMLAINAALDKAIDRVDEIVAVKLRVKAETPSCRAALR